MSSTYLRRSSTKAGNLQDIKSYYTASTIHKAPSRFTPSKNSLYQSLPHIPISGTEGKMLLFNEVFINSSILPSHRARKLKKLNIIKTRSSDFFYQLLTVQTTQVDLTLKDLLCIAELGIPQGDMKKEASIAIAIGDKYLEMRKNLSALKFFKRALVDYKILKDQAGRCVALNRLGIVYHNRGDFETAKKMLKKHKLLCPEDFVPTYNLGIVNRALRSYKESIKYLFRALSIGEEKDNKEEVCIANAQLGLTYKALGDTDIAKQKLVQAIKIAKSIKANSIILELKIAMAYLTYYQGNLHESEKHFYNSMILSVGKKSDVCRINVGVLRGEEKLKEMFACYN